VYTSFAIALCKKVLLTATILVQYDLHMHKHTNTYIQHIIHHYIVNVQQCSKEPCKLKRHMISKKGNN